MDPARVPLPQEPLECRQHAEALLQENDGGGGPAAAIAWALLAIGGQLADIRRYLHRQSRRG